MNSFGFKAGGKQDEFKGLNLKVFLCFFLEYKIGLRYRVSFGGVENVLPLWRWLRNISTYLMPMNYTVKNGKNGLLCYITEYMICYKNSISIKPLKKKKKRRNRQQIQE